MHKEALLRLSISCSAVGSQQQEENAHHIMRYADDKTTLTVIHALIINIIMQCS